MRPSNRQRPRFARRPSLIVGSVLVLLVASVGAVLAGTEALGGKLRTGEVVTVESGETVEGDLYVAAGTVNVDGEITGDLVVAGGDIQVSGTVGGDLIAAGNTVTITGEVTGDARLTGSQLTVDGSVGEDLLVAGGQARVGGAGSVGEDLIAAAGQLSIAGDVAGSVEGGVGAYDRTGTVGGSENIQEGEEGDDDGDEPASAANVLLDALRHFVVVVLVGALALWLLPRLTRGAAEHLQRNTLLALGSGIVSVLGWILFFVAVVLVIILGAIVFGLLQLGAVVGLIVFGGIVAMLVACFLLIVVWGFLADAVVGLGIARFVGREPTSFWFELGLLAVGAAIVVALTTLPVVGGLLKLLVLLLGAGALALAVWRGWRGRRAPPPAVDDSWGRPVEA